MPQHRVTVSDGAGLYTSHSSRPSGDLAVAPASDRADAGGQTYWGAEESGQPFPGYAEKKLIRNSRTANDVHHGSLAVWLPSLISAFRHIGRPSRSMGEHHGSQHYWTSQDAVSGDGCSGSGNDGCDVLQPWKWRHGDQLGAYRRSAVGHGDAVNGTEGAGNPVRPADPHRSTVCGESHLALLTCGLAARCAVLSCGP